MRCSGVDAVSEDFNRSSRCYTMNQCMKGCTGKYSSDVWKRVVNIFSCKCRSQILSTKNSDQIKQQE